MMKKHTVTSSEYPSNATWLRRFLIALTVLAWIMIAGLLLWGLGHIAEAAFLLVIAMLLAYVLYPLLKIVQRFLPRPLAILIIYLAAFALLLFLLYYVVFTAIGQLVNLIITIKNHLPAILATLQPLLALLNQAGISTTQFQLSSQQLLQHALMLLGGLQPLVGTILALFINSIIIISLSIYFLLDGTRVINWLRQKTPKRYRGQIIFFLNTVDQTMGGFIRGQLILATVMSIIVGLCIYLLGVPYALLLALVVFVFEFVPQIGTYISGTIIVLFALFTTGWQTALILLIFSSLVQGILDGQILAPRILGHAVGLHPIVSIAALLIGAHLFGIWGAFFSVPFAGMLQILLIAYWRTWKQTHHEEFAKEPEEEKERGETPVDRTRTGEMQS